MEDKMKKQRRKHRRWHGGSDRIKREGRKEEGVAGRIDKRGKEG